MKKKGFTLIELLAVIVILAVIALIATPIVLNTIEDAKKGSFKSSAYSIVESSDLLYTGNILDNKREQINITYKDSVESSKPSGYKLDYKGSKPKQGTVLINKEGQVELALYDGTYCATKSYTSNEIVVTKVAQEDCIVVDPVYKEAILNGTDPELYSGLIPIIINNDGTITKADINNEWYSYSNKKWANTVLVSEDVRTEYESAAGGATLALSKILAYYVWIPRYKYALTEGQNEAEINIVFEDSTVAKSTGTAELEDYYSHPGFTFGSSEVNGIWVGKFETSHNTLSDDESTNNLGCSDENCSSADGIRILPNVSTVRANNVANSFYASRSMNKTDNAFGITSSSNSHMMKSREWGATAYLAYSKYGQSDAIEINDADYFLTGGGDYISNVAQSTTGNITGIYDMSGGSDEYIMGYLSTASTTFGSASNRNYAGFSSKIDDKYWDNYTSTTVSEACDGGICYGHALSETLNWNQDTYTFVTSTTPWILNGGLYYAGTDAGLFGFTVAPGGDFGDTTFRLVLVGE